MPGSTRGAADRALVRPAPSSKTTFCIFRGVPGCPGPARHDNGPGGHNFPSVPSFSTICWPTRRTLYRLDVLHGKFGVMLGQPVKPA